MTEKQSGLVNRDSYRAETVFDTKNIIDYNIAEKIITIKKFQILSWNQNRKKTKKVVSQRRNQTSTPRSRCFYANK